VSSSRFELGADQGKQIVPASIPRTRVFGGDLFAEIVQDRRSRPSLFFAVVQRQGSTEILMFGQFRSRSEAEDAARQFMADYSSRKRVSSKQSA
jgi:hypothetical protein